MMKMRIRKAIALAMILVMVLSMSAAFAEKRTPSKPFKLPTVQQPATEAPAEDTATEAPAEEPEVPAETEAPAEEPEVPAATEAPAEEPEAPVETEAPETVIATAYVVLADANSTLNVRAAATTDSERLGSLAHGDQVSVVGYEGDWTKIVFGDGYGYVKSSFLSSEAPSTEPEVEPTEEPVVEPTEEPVVEPTEEPVVEPTEEPVEEFEAYTAYVSLQYESSSLNIRKSASEKAKVVGYLYHGDVVTVLGVEGEWTKVDANGVVGYVYSSFLTTTPPVVEEPEVEATEEPVVEPTEEPVVEETEEPVVEPTEEPVVEATEEPEEEEPVVEETEEPVVEPTEEPVVEAEAEEITYDVPVTGNDADVRIEGDGLSEIFVTLPVGTPLTVLGVEGDWVMVDIDGQIGYIYIDDVLGVEVEEPEVPVDPEAEPIKKVTIFSSRRSVVVPGEPIYLTSKLEGFENSTVIIFQWQYDRGNGFEDVPGATEDNYSFEASIETLGYDWRLMVMSD